MKFAKRRCVWKLIFGMLSLSACAGAPKVTPHILDTQLGEMREYRFTNDYDLRGPVKIHDMQWGRDTYGNGFMCIPLDEAAKFRRWAMQQKIMCEGK